MDPYLEQAVFWSEFHSRLIVGLADALAPSLLPRSYVGVETRSQAMIPWNGPLPSCKFCWNGAGTITVNKRFQPSIPCWMICQEPAAGVNRAIAKSVA
jgi:hypothetical protein